MYDSAAAAGALTFLLAVLGIGLLIAILYLLTLQRTLEQVQPQNRDVPPTNVWLMFIPLFNIIYPFILYPRISNSVSREYAERGLPADGDFSRNIGIAMPILSLCGIIPVLGNLAAIANLVLFIIFWTKMGKYKNTLILNPHTSQVRLSTNEELID